MARNTKAGYLLTGLVVSALAVRATQIYYSGSKEAAWAAGPVATEADPSLLVQMETSLSHFPQVDRYLETFMAATDQAITSWLDEGKELPIERRELFLRILYDFRAICTIESGGNEIAVSPDGKHLGLCQLNSETSYFVAEGETPSILFDPHFNIYRGEWYYFVLWMKAYDRLGGADLDRVSRFAAAGYYEGGANVGSDENDWDASVNEYVRRFIIASQKGVYP